MGFQLRMRDPLGPPFASDRDIGLRERPVHVAADAVVQ